MTRREKQQRTRSSLLRAAAKVFCKWTPPTRRGTRTFARSRPPASERCASGWSRCTSGGTAAFPAAPPLPLEDITAMTYFMADGFLVDQLIEPELSEGLYTTMLTVFFRGLEAMAVGWEPSESDLPLAAK